MKPCPFCGETEDLEFQTQTPDREGIPTNVTCGFCGACGPWVYAVSMDDHKKAEEEWNNRVFE